MVRWKYSQNSTRSVSRLFHPWSCSMDSSLSPGTNCTPEIWQKILWYNFLLMLPTFMVCRNQSWLSQISMYYIACLLCNSWSSVGGPEWLHFKLHLDIQLPARAELTFLTGHSTRRAKFARERCPWEVQRQERVAREERWRKDPTWIKVGLCIPTWTVPVSWLILQA